MNDHSAITSWLAPHDIGRHSKLTAPASFGYRGLHDYPPLGLT